MLVFIPAFVIFVYTFVFLPTYSSISHSPAFLTLLSSPEERFLLACATTYTFIRLHPARHRSSRTSYSSSVLNNTRSEPIAFNSFIVKALAVRPSYEVAITNDIDWDAYYEYLHASAEDAALKSLVNQLQILAFLYGAFLAFLVFLGMLATDDGHTKVLHQSFDILDITLRDDVDRNSVPSSVLFLSGNLIAVELVPVIFPHPSPEPDDLVSDSADDEADTISLPSSKFFAADDIVRFELTLGFPASPVATKHGIPAHQRCSQTVVARVVIACAITHKLLEYKKMQKLGEDAANVKEASILGSCTSASAQPTESPTKEIMAPGGLPEAYPVQLMETPEQLVETSSCPAVLVQPTEAPGCSTEESLLISTQPAEAPSCQSSSSSGIKVLTKEHDEDILCSPSSSDSGEHRIDAKKTKMYQKKRGRRKQRKKEKQRGGVERKSHIDKRDMDMMKEGKKQKEDGEMVQKAPSSEELVSARCSDVPQAVEEVHDVDVPCPSSASYTDDCRSETKDDISTSTPPISVSSGPLRLSKVTGARRKRRMSGRRMRANGRKRRRRMRR